jgi:hypothetical protein
LKWLLSGDNCDEHPDSEVFEGMYIGGGLIALILIIVLLAWLL